jgi:DNA modification methylase
VIDLRLGDCLEVMREMPDDSVDACVTDPPYGWSFMGKRWDYDVPAVEVWREVYRVLRPGAHILVACGTRTQHRMAVNIEDAGFEIRDVITWLYGSGFPKSMDISKAIDKEAGAERDDAIKGVHIGISVNGGDADNDNELGNSVYHGINKGAATRGAPATPAAVRWQGWGTALKPACEFWTLARKPLAERTVAANVLAWGTGGVNVDGCRVATDELTPRNNKVGDNGWKNSSGGYIELSPLGRFPANLILDEDAAALLDEQSGVCGAYAPVKSGHSGKSKGIYGDYAQRGDDGATFYGERSGGASRFFYCAKASKGERDAGCEGLPETVKVWNGQSDKSSTDVKPVEERWTTNMRNYHPTVKPVALMRYLCRLITPPRGVVLDPFMGSGSTGIGATLEGFGFIGVEMDADYHEIARRRIEHWREQNTPEPQLELEMCIAPSGQIAAS